MSKHYDIFKQVLGETKKPKLGSGERFKKLSKEVGSDALAAYIGRKKYGKKKFAQLAEDTLTEDHRKVAVFAINHFGSGGHPEASDDNLHHFGTSYVHKTVKRAVASDKTSAELKKIGNEILKDKMSFLKEDEELDEANSIHTARIKQDWHNKAADDYRKRADADDKRSDTKVFGNTYRKLANRHAQAALAADRVIKKKKLDEAKEAGKSRPGSFWSYKAQKPDVEPPKDTKMSRDEWEQLSPGMRREISRQSKKPVNEATLGGEKYKGKENPNNTKHSSWYELRARSHFGETDKHSADAVASRAGYRPGGIKASIASMKKAKRHSQAQGIAKQLEIARKKEED